VTDVAAAVREWVTIAVPGKERKRWQIDVTYMLSHWQCLFGCGCQGVLTEPAPDLVHGCCSYGAHADDERDRRHVEKVAKQLRPDEWQFQEIGKERGVWAKVGKDRRTRLVDGACIFLNRPGFVAGPGCALHVLAIRQGVHFSETKPTVCWQLPLRAIPRDEEDGSETTVLTEFGRDGWGEGGDEFAWWCTEAAESFTEGEPVYKTLRDELVALTSEEAYGMLAGYLANRTNGSPEPLTHPAERPVKFIKKKTKR
jgi:hypothetical protein